MNNLKKVYCRIYQEAFHMAIPLLPYTEPKLLKGMGSIVPFLKKKGVESLLILSGRTVHRHPLMQKLEKKLAEAEIRYEVYDKTVPNPTIDNIEEAVKIYREIDAQAILSIGGGSVMDCAKIVGARVARPHLPVQKMKGLLKIIRPTPLFIAIPTTAGSGSETTLAAVITDSETHYKYPINDFVLIPDYAILVPQLTIGLPEMLTATTGMDALTHAVEAYIGRSTTKLTRDMAEEAVCLIVKNLYRAYEKGEDKEARRNMLRASYCAGVAFTRSYVGYVHAVAHSLGGQYGIAHGLANAIILPYFLEEYGTDCSEKLARLARLSGIADKKASDGSASAAFISWIRRMNTIMGIPDKIPEIRREDIPEMAARADKEANPLYPVPKLMDKRALGEMYERLMP